MIEKVAQDVNGVKELNPKFENNNTRENLNPNFFNENFSKKDVSESTKENLNPNFYKCELERNYSENIIKNKEDGLRRENDVETDLKEKYPEKEGYKVESEVYLRDKDGNIVKDEKTGEARRIDFVVTKDGKVVDSIEVTSKTADKTDQLAKEERIREKGGNYIKDSNGNLIEIPQNVHTRIERRV